MSDDQVWDYEYEYSSKEDAFPLPYQSMTRAELPRVNWRTVCLAMELLSQKEELQHPPPKIRGHVCVKHRALPLRRVCAIPIETPGTRSLLRLRRKMIANLHLMKTFVTLTFDNDSIDLLNDQFASSWIRDRLRIARKELYLPPSTQYLWRFELGGEHLRPHFHIVFDRFINIDQLYKAFGHVGLIHVRGLHNRAKALAYCCKYLSKAQVEGINDLYAISTQRLWGASRGWQNGQSQWTRDLGQDGSEEEFQQRRAANFEILRLPGMLEKVAPHALAGELYGTFTDVGLFDDDWIANVTLKLVRGDELNMLEDIVLLRWRQSKIGQKKLDEVSTESAPPSMKRMRERAARNRTDFCSLFPKK